MGRAERRMRERRQRIEDKKGKVYLRPEDIRKMKEDISNLAARYDVEILLTCFAQVLHDEFGFGYKRVLRALQAVDDTFGRVLNDELDIDDMKRRLEDDVGIRIKYDGGKRK